MTQQTQRDTLDGGPGDPPRKVRTTSGARALLSVQALLLVGGAASLWSAEPPSVLVAVIALVAAVASLAQAVALRRWPQRTRRAALYLAVLLIPLHAVLIGMGAPPLVAVLGLAVAGALLGVLRPRFGTLRPRARKTWLVLHVGFSVGWLGAAMAMLVLALVGASTTNMQLRHYAYEIMHIFDLAIVIPLVLLSLLTGLVVSLGTKWGLVRYRWVLTKFVIALSIPVFAALEESSWVRQAGTLTGADRDADLASTDTKLWACFVVFSLLLWAATALSTTKPWGRTRWGQPNLRRAARSHPPTQNHARRPHESIDDPRVGSQAVASRRTP